MEVVKANGLPTRLAGLKRKRHVARPTPESEESLRWRPVPRAHLQSGLDDAVLSFEEIDGVDVQFEEVEGGGRIAKFSVSSCIIYLDVMLRFTLVRYHWDFKK